MAFIIAVMRRREAIHVDESTIDFPSFLLFFITKFAIFPIFSIPSFLFFWSNHAAGHPALTIHLFTAKRLRRQRVTLHCFIQMSSASFHKFVHSGRNGERWHLLCAWSLGRLVNSLSHRVSNIKLLLTIPIHNGEERLWETITAGHLGGMLWSFTNFSRLIVVGNV